MTSASAQDRKGPLNEKRIVDAALTIIDGEGLPALNMRRLGAELSVKAMAVYKHFPNKDAILDGIVAAVLCDLEESTGESDWHEGFRSAFLSLRSLCARTPTPSRSSPPAHCPRLSWQDAWSRLATCCWMLGWTKKTCFIGFTPASA